MAFLPCVTFFSWVKPVPHYATQQNVLNVEFHRSQNDCGCSYVLKPSRVLGSAFFSRNPVFRSANVYRFEPVDRLISCKKSGSIDEKFETNSYSSKKTSAAKYQGENIQGDAGQISVRAPENPDVDSSVVEDSSTETSDGITRCGFVALIGAPNAGKSTLLNLLVGGKVSIVTPKIQTTRRRVLGICMCEAAAGRSEPKQTAQLVFIDTPGIFHATSGRRLERAMVSAAWSAARDAEVVVVLVDASTYNQPQLKMESAGAVREIVHVLRDNKQRAILALNKVDLLRKDQGSVEGVQREILNDLDPERVIFDEAFAISAVEGTGVEQLRDRLAEHVPEGPFLFPADQLSDLPMRLLAAEITREKMFLRLHDELPYASTVETEQWNERSNGSVVINQVIYVQRDTQKSIVLGKGGSMIKTIGMEARTELQQLLGAQVHLYLFVKVRENWLEDRARYDDMGLEFNV